MKKLLVNTLIRLGFWPFILTFTILATILAKLLIIPQNYWLTGEAFDRDLQTIVFFTTIIVAPILLFFIALLIQDLKQNEEDLGLLKYAIEQSSEASFLVDEDGRFKRVNKAASLLLGYSEDELLKMKVTDIDPDFPVSQWRRHFGEIKRLGSLTMESRYQKKDEEIFQVEITINYVLYHGKNYLLGFVKDLTERKIALQQAKEQEDIMIAQSRHAAMGEMIGMIAHQWRQPITVISMGASNILADIELQETSEESLRRQAEKIIKQTMHLSKTIDDFRDFFQPAKASEETTVYEVVLEAEKIIGKSLESRGIKLDIDSNSMFRLKTYARELLQVYINLINNARDVLVDKKIKEPTITITITEDNSHVITTLCDNGGGFDETILNRVFDPYFTTKEKLNGTGLGLYISKTIVEKHLKGSIIAENSKEGACLTISLPTSSSV